MKYVLYIDYRANYKPLTSEYRKLEVKTLSDAMLEADKQYNPDTIYLMRIMVKDGKAEKVESDIIKRHLLNGLKLCDIFPAGCHSWPGFLYLYPFRQFV